MPPKLAVPDEAEEICDIDFGVVAGELLAVLTADRRCLRCGHRVAQHAISSRPATQPLANLLPGGGLSKEEKKLAAMRDAQARSRAMRSAYVPNFREVPSIHLGLALRHAGAGHLGVLGCPGLVVGHLPDQPSADLYVRPWVRARHLRRVVDAIDYAIAAHRHVTLRPSRDPLPRSVIFSDARLGAPDWPAAEVSELQRALKALAIGLGAIEDRDPTVFGKAYADVDMRLTHHAAGRLNPFIFTRTSTMDSLCAWLVALRDGAELPRIGPAPAPMMAAAAGAAAAGAAAEEGGGGSSAAAARERAAPSVDLESWARDWPLIGLGHACTVGFGEASRATANSAWEALESADAFAIGELRLYFGTTASMTRGADVGGVGSDAAPVRKRKRAGSGGGGGGGSIAVDRRGGAGSHAQKGEFRVKGTAGRAAGGGALPGPSGTVGTGGLRGEGGGAGGSGGGGTAGGWLTPQQRAEAKARVAGKGVDDVTRDDCLDAQLCFTCKRPRHAAGAACVARGRTL
jgi:hypothetical protein